MAMNILVPKADYPRNEVISKTDRVTITPHLPYIKYVCFKCTRHAVARKNTLFWPVKLLHTHYVSYFTL